MSKFDMCNSYIPTYLLTYVAKRIIILVFKKNADFFRRFFRRFFSTKIYKGNRRKHRSLQ
jgi:hypothetical protein